MRRHSRVADGRPGIPILGKPGRLVIVMAILIVAGGLLLQRSQSGPPPTERHHRLLAQRNLRTLRAAIDQFKLDCGAYPSTQDGLASLLLNPGRAGWKGPYILELKPDPWGFSFQFQSVPGQCVLFSLGPDGKTNTLDDVRIEWSDQLAIDPNAGVYPARIDGRKPAAQ